MAGTSEFVSFPAQSSRFHLPTLRFALRSVVASGNYDESFIDLDERLLRLVGPALQWQEPMRMALSGKFAMEVKRHPPESSDSVSLASLLLCNHSLLWDTYHTEVTNTWHREPAAVVSAFTETLALLETDTLRHKGEHSNLEYVASLYQLDQLETEILQFAVTSQQWPEFRDFLKNLKFPSMGAAWGLVAAMVGCTEVELKKALEPNNKLRSNHLIKLDHAPYHMEEIVRVGPVAYRLFLVYADSREGLQARFLDPAPPPKLTIADFAHLSEEIQWVAQCLKSAAHGRERGVNVLIQGPTGIGKTEVARLLVQACGLAGFEVQPDLTNKDVMDEIATRLEHYQWMQQILQTHAGAVLVFDGINIAADICESLLLEKLDSCSVPTVWVGGESRPMSDSIIRRFVYHLTLNQPPESTRRHLLTQLTSGFQMAPETLETIATEPAISPAQLTMAARFAHLAGKDAGALKPKAMLGAIDASQRIIGRAPLSLMHPANGSTWDIDALNLESSAPLARILDGLRRTGRASLAFHGTPGTGKSSLASYIASTLDRPLLTKRVSDLSSKWLGETEKAIANMFHEASADGSVLLVDEADSFLRDRRTARSPWEVTQVNELLQQMESFKGIFICATNLVESLDAAAMRRFTFKIKFLPLDAAHRCRMLAVYALADANAELPQPIGDRLAALTELAPGDFATVRRQEELIDERFSLESWITELEREHAIRVPTNNRRAAFV